MPSQTILTLNRSIPRLRKTQDILDQITDEADQTQYAVPRRPLAVLRRDTGVGLAIPDEGNYAGATANARRFMGKEAENSKWKPVDESTSAWQPVEEKSAEKPLTSSAPPQTFSHAAEEFGSQINPIPMITGTYNAVRHPIDTARNIYAAQTNELSQVPKLIRQGRYSEAAGHGAAGLVPLVGPAAAKIGEQIGEGDVAGGLGAGAGLITSVVAPPIATKGAGKVLKSASPSLAEAAMRVGKADRLTEANPGKALIEETSKVRPASIVRDLSAKKSGLVNETTNLAKASPNLVDFSSAESPIAARQALARGAGATTTAEELQPLRDYWSGEPEPGFTGNVALRGGQFRKSLLQPAEQALQMRREFGPNFRIRYGPQADRELTKLGQKSYRGSTAAVKTALPEIAPLDERVHDIIPAIRAAESTSRNAGLFQRSAGRIAAHTGALAGAALGYHTAGLPGALLGLVGPELLADPTSMMIGARGLNTAGKGLDWIGSSHGPVVNAPIIGRRLPILPPPIQGLQLVRQRQEAQ